MNTMPDSNKIYPNPDNKSLCYLKNIIKNPNISVGDFTFYHNFDNPLNFEKNVLYQYPCNNDKLIIGKFCSIASDAKFIFNGANHTLNSIASYPFPVLADEWNLEAQVTDAWDNKGDIIIGNDVWLGYDSIIMAGVTIGDGAIIATRALVKKDVEPYSIVGGIPAKPIRKRFDDETIELLLEIKWWDWDTNKIQKFLPIIQSGNIKLLKETLNQWK